MTLLTPTAYARHRGVTEKAVRKAIASGRITTQSDPQGRVRIDPATADPSWRANAAQAANSGRARPRTPGAGVTLTEAQRRVTIQRARGLKLRNDELARRLVRADAVARAWAAHVLAVRTPLETFALRLQHRLPHLTRDDVAVVDALLREDLDRLASSGSEASG